MPQDFSLSYTNSLTPKRNSSRRSNLYQYLEKGVIQQNPADSAKQLKAMGNNTNGYYWIKKNDGSAVYAYCILEDIDGGGWTRLDSSIASISNGAASTSWSGSTLIVNFVDNNGCTGTNNHTITGTIPYTEMMIFSYRQSGIGQCQGFSGQVQSGYYDGAFTSKDNVVGISMCTWASGPHTNGTTTLSSSQKRQYFFRITGSNSFSTLYRVACNGGNGRADQTIWVRVT